MTISQARKDTIYQYLETHGGSTQVDLRRAFPHIHTSDISHVVAEGCRQGILVSDGRNKRRYWLVSMIPEEEE